MEAQRAFLTHSPEATEALGEALARHVRSGDAIALVGDLGAGKTCLVRGIARGLGSPDLVTSPTFVILHTYRVQASQQIRSLHHLDLYRLSGDAELEDVGGLDVLYGEDATVVEWAERAPGIFPPTALWVHIDVASEHARRITLRGPQARFDWIERLDVPHAGIEG